MKKAGFDIRYSNDEMLKRYAKLFFDSDEDGLKEGWVTPQHYFASLMFANPLTSIPDAAGKETSFLFVLFYFTNEPLTNSCIYLGSFCWTCQFLIPWFWTCHRSIAS